MTVDQILDGILEREGDYVDHPADPGGATKYGITIRTLESWRGRRVTRRELKALTKDTAREIYRRQYVEGPGFDQLPEGRVQNQLVDHAVLSGSRRAIQDLQKVLKVTVDGILGPVTRGVLEATDQTWLNAELARIRTERLVDLALSDPSQLQFLRGWVRRALSFL